MVQELAAEISLSSGLSATLVMILLKIGIVAAVFLPLISVVAMFSIWWERKVAGHIQGRVGPMHVGMWHGWAQSIADGVKLILKEDLIPDGADRFLFRLAPYLAFAPVFAAFLALPFGPTFVFENGLNIGLLYILAVLAIEILGTILAGWGSNSKWAIYGAMREACQMVSYEIPLGIALLCGVLVAGTLDPVELSYLQGRGIWTWFIFHNPFILIAFVLYFVAALASSKRAPFDLPESESELVAGFHTEYSGLRFSFFFFAEYAGMFIIGMITACLFLGGWNSPLGTVDPVYWLLGFDPVAGGQAYMSGAMADALTANATAVTPDRSWAVIGTELGMANGALGAFGGLLALNLYSAFWMIVKTMGFVFVNMWLRWTLPRIRIDQVMYTCVKVLLPASLIMLAGTAAWVAVEEHLRPGTGASGEALRGAYLYAELTPTFTTVTQIVLCIAAIGFVFFSFGTMILSGLMFRRSQPPRSFFTDVMPVTNDISFTKTKVDTPEAGEGDADAAVTTPA